MWMNLVANDLSQLRKQNCRTVYHRDREGLYLYGSLSVRLVKHLLVYIKSSPKVSLGLAIQYFGDQALILLQEKWVQPRKNI